MADNIPLPKPEYDKKLTNFYYNGQLTSYSIQFMSLFSDMQVKIGKNDSGSKTDIIHVPIRFGSMDRVVASIKANNTQNTMMRLPAMAANLVGMEMMPERYTGMGTHDRHVHLPLGGVMPDDLKVTYRQKHVPYRGIYELAVLTSNKDQQFQIIEQISLLFNPVLQIQTSDAAQDASKLSTVELKSISMDENYPPGGDKRNILTTFNFETILYMASPYNQRDEVVKRIKLRLATVPTYGDVYETVVDVDRELPVYDILFDIDDYQIPSS